jgi:hypothetical protein
MEFSDAAAPKKDAFQLILGVFFCNLGGGWL